MKTNLIIPIWDLLQKSTRLDSICTEIIDRISLSMNCERASIFFIDQDKNALYSFVAHLSELNMIKVPLDKGIVGLCIKQKTPIIENNPYNNPSFYSEIDRKSSFKTRSILAVPLVDDGYVFGTIECLNKKKGQFNKQDIKIAVELADHVKSAVKNSTFWKSLKGGKYGSISALNRFNGIIGESPSMQKVYKLMEKAIQSDMTVLLTGATGTGKSLIASTIANNCAHREQRITNIDCTAVPETLFEAELFGYEKGAFTGAFRLHKGKFETSHRGTLFIDEIGELPLQLQPKLLRFLQEMKFERIGGTKTVEVDTRLIVATNRNLRKMIDMDLFREDLFYRLNVFEIPIPSLRERGTSDITVLAEYFITKFQKKYSRFNLEIPDSFYKEIIKYDWPGNVRELENFIESAIVRADRELCFSKLFENRQLIDKRILSKIKKIKTQELKNQNEISKTFDYILENMTLSSLENSLIVHALNRKMAKPLVAEFLGVSRSTFWRKVKSLGLDLKYSYRE